MRFNQTLHPAGDRNSSRGGNHRQDITLAECIFYFSQDPRTPRLLPAVDRALDSAPSNSAWNRLRLLVRETLRKRAALCELQRTEDACRTSNGYRTSLGRAGANGWPHETDLQFRTVITDARLQRFMMFTEFRGGNAIDNDLSAVMSPGT